LFPYWSEIRLAKSSFISPVSLLLSRLLQGVKDLQTVKLRQEAGYRAKLP